MPSSSTPYAKTVQVGRSRSDVSLMRDKNGCITCRVRQKKCSGIEIGQTSCGDCLRLNIQCLGVTHNRPDWLRNPEALKETKYRIKVGFISAVVLAQGLADLVYSTWSLTSNSEECHQYVKLDQLQPMSPESPSTNYPGGYLSVPTSHYGSPTSSSPSSSYTAMPSTPTNLSDDLFASTDMCNYAGGIMTPELFYTQQQGSNQYLQPLAKLPLVAVPIALTMRPRNLCFSPALAPTLSITSTPTTTYLDRQVPVRGASDSYEYDGSPSRLDQKRLAAQLCPQSPENTYTNIKRIYAPNQLSSEVKWLRLGPPRHLHIGKTL
ncbi:fungal zn(2)-Cys(6) binuclear cluster domain-containing protein [Rhizoctonia solani AG-1 IA]|uniref:Fungal zn(2)-Cys(6) binuclear cluster domain-containing protein n=1 Tax=Thanatephorus cucumeris (strain AG1-IA) TaxID=983506 RepID=L8X9G8_THACA|nr:fungal zn(2)-Cys(6) binuclear cluster domain-containing protein [Rhizoctonia solani AG-1 IA]